MTTPAHLSVSSKLQVRSCRQMAVFVILNTTGRPYHSCRRCPHLRRTYPGLCRVRRKEGRRIAVHHLCWPHGVFSEAEPFRNIPRRVAGIRALIRSESVGKNLGKNLFKHAQKGSKRIKASLPLFFSLFNRKRVVSIWTQLA